MDEVNQWALTVAVTAIVGGVILAAIPQGKLKKSAGYAVALVVVCCFFLPLASGEIGFDMETDFGFTRQEPEQPLRSRVDESVLEYAAYELEAELKDCAGAAGCEIESADVSLSLDGENTVSVEAVTVTGALDESEKSEVERIAHELFGEAVRVEFS